jgi:hypothetical protein
MPLEPFAFETVRLQISAWKSEHQPSGGGRREAARVNRKPHFSVDDPAQGKVYFSMRLSVTAGKARLPLQGFAGKSSQGHCKGEMP